MGGGEGRGEGGERSTVVSSTWCCRLNLYCHFFF